MTFIGRAQTVATAGLLAIGLASCQVGTDTPTQEQDRPSGATTPGAGDDSFQDTILADSVVTRAELEQAYGRLFDCFRDGRAVGEVWIDLDLSSSYSISLAVPEANGTFPIDGQAAGSLIESLMTSCESTYIDRVQRAYAAEHPDDPATTDRKRQLILSCLGDKLPDVRTTVPDTGTLEEVREAAYQNADGSDRPLVQICVERYGQPTQDLQTAVP